MQETGNRKVFREYISPQKPKTCGRFLLDRIGEMVCDSEYKIDEPEQGGYKIIYMISGKAMITVRSTEYVLKPSQLCLIRPQEAYSMSCDAEDPVRCFYISFGFLDKTHIEDLTDIFHALFLENPICVAEVSADIYNIYARIVGELFTADAFTGRMLELTLEQLLLYVCRVFSLTVKVGQRTDHAGEGNIVERIVDLIQANCGTLKNLTDLSKMLGYSYSYLSHVFSKQMGRSIKEYHQQVLFERAVEMLKEDMSITQISEQLGYQAIHSFSRAFSNHYGVSPSRYIENLKRAALRDGTRDWQE